MKEITKFNGLKCDIKKCKKLGNLYYEKEVDCFKMSDGKWHRIDNGKIRYDHETKKAYFISEAPIMINGIVDVIDKKIITGYFSQNIYKNVKLLITDPKEKPYVEFRTGRVVCINEGVAKKLGYKRHRLCADWTFKGQYVSSNVLNAENYQYTCDQSLPEAIQIFRKYKSENKINTSIPLYLKTKYTYGLEIETSNGSGIISSNDCNKYGLIPLKDGSLRSSNSSVLSFEYATVPYDIKDVHEFVPKICKAFKNSCRFNETCSLHLHVGNFNATLLNSVALWVLIRKIQNEILEMFPNYKKDPTIIGKSKNYCKKLPDIGIETSLKKNKNVPMMFKIKPLYSNLFKFLSGGKDLDDTLNRQTLRHPQSRKWNIDTRYYIVNLVSLIFSSNKTVEFRIHTPTFNEDKIINWIYICSSILQYVEDNAIRILSNDDKLSLELIIKQSCNKNIAENLINYINYRKKMYKNSDGDDFKEEFNNDFDKLNNNLIIK